MSKVTSINRALRPVRGQRGQAASRRDEMGQVQELLDNYQSREQDQQVGALHQHFTEVVAQLNEKFDNQSRETGLQISHMQNMLDSERQNTLSAIDNLKSLFDGNYTVMADLANRYESEQEYVKQEIQHGSLSFEDKLARLHQESTDRFNEIRYSLERAQTEERLRFAHALRELADSL